MNMELFTAFLLITLVLVLTPGPIVTLVISTGATQGVRAALTTVAGTTLGNVLLLTAIAFGLSWVLVHALVLFEVLRWGGAAYLVWLGVQAWRHAGKSGPGLAPSGRVHFTRGVLVALSNPKTIVFFTAFLPQFIDPNLPAGPQLAAMCIASALLAMVTDSSWAIASGLGRAWFMKPARAKLLGRLSGTALIGGGIWLSLARRPS
ncbi:LysE family translocator [Methylocapsa sp. S129]|uniref:LysE family translocator n=1 Tax=Methylocapsa sp. S129 TaxID=1641869 RepID=UPI00131BC9D2|nr:LysE family translocator [Methylocapsa sp. S129]